MTTELHLFAGIGGGILAGQMLGHRPVVAVEKNEFCRAVLADRFPDLELHYNPQVWTMVVRGLDGEPLPIRCNSQAWGQAGVRHRSLGDSVA